MGISAHVAVRHTPPPGSPKSGHSALPFARSTVLLVGGSADWHIQQSVMEFAAM